MLEHLGDLVLHAEPDTLEVDGDRVIPVFLGAVSRWSVRPRNTGVVMRIIQSAVGLHDLLNQRFNLGCFRDIGPHKKSISPGLFDYPYGLLTAVDSDVRNNSSRPFSDKRQCTCLSYSRSGTRHQGHFAFELLGHLAPLTGQANSIYLEPRNTVNAASGAVYRVGTAPYSGAATTDETDRYGATTGGRFVLISCEAVQPRTGIFTIRLKSETRRLRRDGLIMRLSRSRTPFGLP